MKRIILSGANGAMGHEIAACINNRDDCKIVAGLDINTNVYSDFPIYNNADELTCGADAVSYTHLDVYKRQILLIEFCHTMCQSNGMQGIFRLFHCPLLQPWKNTIGSGLGRQSKK